MGIIRDSFGLLLTTGNSNYCIIVKQGTKVVKGHFTILKIVPHEFLIRTVTWDAKKNKSKLSNKHKKWNKPVDCKLQWGNVFQECQSAWAYC